MPTTYKEWREDGEVGHEPWEKRMLRHAAYWLEHCMFNSLPAGRPIIFSPPAYIIQALWIIRNLYEDLPWDSGWREAFAEANAIMASVGKKNYGVN